MQINIKKFVPHLKLSLIDVAVDNVRKTGLKKGLDELIDSIDSFGLLQPITVFPKDGRYKVLVGQRKFLACNELNWTSVPAFIIGNLSSRTKTIVSYSENAHRQQLPYEDSVQACNKLFDQYTGNKKDRIEKIQRDLGISKYQISKFLAHIIVPPEVRRMITEKKISEDLAYRITATNSPNASKIIEIAKKAPRMTKAESQRTMEFGKKNPKASVKEILDYAKSPPPLIKFIIHLEPHTMEIMKSVSKKRRMSIETFVKDAIERSIEET